jgi:HCOMODA/2-hydroxy-3-carboxy-muconic semialdehyde decarboxylase
MVGMFGHVSVMTEDTQRYLICPGAGTRKDLCRPEEVIELDVNAEFEPGRPLELYMHAQAHQLKPETMRSLIHVHSPALTALSTVAEIPGELLMVHAGFWPKEMPVWDEAELVRDHDRGRQLIELMGEESIALLRWHGAVIVGATVQEAVWRTLMAETHAQHVLTALGHGQPLAAVPDDVDRAELYERLSPDWTHEMLWRLESSYVSLTPGSRLH